MFKKLKRKFILTNLLTSTIVLVVGFSAIYFFAANASHQRVIKPLEENHPDFSQQPKEADRAEFNEYLAERINDDRQDMLHVLLITLIVTGLSIEAIIALVSFYLAEQSIKPVRDAYNAQKDFVANASHEIKTPLAVIQANLEAADIEGNQWLDNVQKKVDDLALLNNQLLALARSDSIKEEIKLEDVDLNKLVSDAINAFEPKAEEQGKTITRSSSVKKGTKVKLNRKALEQILNIYIDNGVKYCKNTVAINIKKDRIHVISDGDPMDRDQIPHLFDRFYQSDKTKEGVGLGLAIAASIAEKNDWKLSAKVDEEYKTNIFTLEFK